MASVAEMKLKSGGISYEVRWRNEERRLKRKTFRDKSKAETFAESLAYLMRSPGPRRYVPMVERIKRSITVNDSGCWIWQLRTMPTEGYGLIGVRTQPGKHRTCLAHRVSYETFVGPIPDGLQIDHQCHNQDPDCSGGITCAHRACVNPAHLRAVTPRQNIFASHSAMAAINAAKTHCPHGHPYDEQNTYVYRRGRVCKACMGIRYRLRRKEASA